MPVPWGKNSAQGPGPEFSTAKPCKIPEARDRAVTLRQLRELKDFCQRLCKVGLLKYPDDAFNTSLGRNGKRVKWTQLTQHEICNLVVKKIIPREHSCSWAEVVAGGSPQRRTFFCSHNWGECFRDFMVSIEAHVKEQGVGTEQSYWICVYANNQHNVELGRTLAESPFYQALQDAQATLLMLDKTAEALLRLWCVFELNETLITLKQRLELWTPLGRVGSGLVSSGPVVQALNRIDTCAAQASNSVDQRQILNHIAGIEETTAIIVHPNSAKELDEAEEKHLKGKYEANLIDNYRTRFQNLNEAIIQSVTTAIQSPETLTVLKKSFSQASMSLRKSKTWASTKRRCTIDDGTMRGITLQQLRDFHQKMKLDFEQAPQGLEVRGKMRTYDTADMYVVDKLYLDPARTQAGCSFVELIANEEARPNYHVIYGSQIIFKDFMAALEWHAEARQLPDSTAYFIVPFMLDPDDSTRPEETKWTKKRPPTRQVLENHAIGVVMLIDQKANVLSRCIPAWEADFGIRRGLCFDLAASSGALATTRPFANNAWEFGDFDACLAEKALKFDVATTTGNQDSDRPRYLGEIAFDHPVEEDSQLPSSEDNVRFMRLNQRLRQKVAGPVLREAGYSGNIESIHKVLNACPNLHFNNTNLLGTLGETAVHTAAASGHTDVIKLLLTLKAPVNSQDAMGETPLHYAAMTGQAEAARLLLEMGADPETESFDAETPLHVARLNPAYFVPVCTKAVTEVLTGIVATPSGSKAMALPRALPANLQPMSAAEQLRLENQDLRLNVAELIKQLSELKAQLRNHSNQDCWPGESSRVKEVFSANGVKCLKPSALHDLLSQVTGMGETEINTLIDAANNAISYNAPGKELDCEWFLDWLSDSWTPKPVEAVMPAP